LVVVEAGPEEILKLVEVGVNIALTPIKAILLLPLEPVRLARAGVRAPPALVEVVGRPHFSRMMVTLSML